MRKILLFLMLAAAMSAASAQVFRCTDAKGKLSYSDSPCPNSQQAAQIERSRSNESIAIERERAELARERFELSQERQAQQRQPVPPPTAPVLIGGQPVSRECEIAQKNATGRDRRQAQRLADVACLGADGAAQVEAARRANAPRRTNTNCRTDSFGNTYCDSITR